MISFFSQYRESYANLPKSIWGLTYASVINSAGRVVLTFLALYLLIELHLSPSEIGMLMMAYGLGAVLGGYLGGTLCEYFHGKWVVIFSLILSCFSMISLTFLSQGNPFFWALLFVGIADSAFHPAFNIIIMSWCSPKDRSRAYALQRVARNLGAAFAGLLGSLVWSIQISLIFWVDGITCLFAAYTLYSLSKGTAPHIHLSPLLEKTSVSVHPSPWKDRFFLALSVIIFINIFVFFQTKTTYPLFLNEHYKISPSVFGLLLAFNSLLTIFLQVPLINYLRGHNPLSSAALGSGLLCLGFLFLPFGNSLAFVLLTCFLWTIGEIIFFPMTLDIVFQRAEHGRAGSYMAIHGTLFSIGYMVAPAVGGLIYGYWNGTLLWIVCGFVGVISMLGFHLLQRVFKQLQKESLKGIKTQNTNEDSIEQEL